MKQALLYLFLFACATVLFSCSPMQVAGGSDNPDFKVSGIIVDSLGNPVQHTIVKLIPANFNPETDAATHIVFDTTDSDGCYAFSTSRAGTYTILGANPLQSTKCYIPDVAIADAVTKIHEDTLRKTGAIRVIVPVAADSVPAYAYIPGTDIWVPVPISSRIVLIDSVPPGMMPSICFGLRSKASTISTLATLVMVYSGRSTLAGNAGWNFSRKMYLNTTASGAALGNAVYGFPVLVRLRSDNFNFSEAKSNGDDIRFLKPDSTPVPYEIEQWDAAGQTAQIWVKVDTVYGNDSSHFMTMEWGNPNGSSNSAGNAVFDTANGFQGVWHMGESGTQVKDATINHYDGTRAATMPATPVSGAIGNCQQFNGTTDSIEMPGTASGKLDYQENGTYMVSAWVYADTLNGIHHEIVSKGWYQYFLEVGAHNTWEFNVLKSAVGWDNSNYPASSKAWTFVAGVRSGTSQYLYVNGTCIDSSSKIGNATTQVRNTGENLKIGTHYGPDDPYPWFFKGNIDEVRIMNKSPSADWIKLCYINQKSIDKLLKW